MQATNPVLSVHVVGHRRSGSHFDAVGGVPQLERSRLLSGSSMPICPGCGGVRGATLPLSPPLTPANPVGPSVEAASGIVLSPPSPIISSISAAAPRAPCGGSTGTVVQGRNGRRPVRLVAHGIHVARNRRAPRFGKPKNDEESNSPGVTGVSCPPVDSHNRL